MNMAMRKDVPEYTEPANPVLEPTEIQKPVPEYTPSDKKVPEIGHPENTVVIGGRQIEIKSTKVKYQRDRTASFYMLLKKAPLVEILSLQDGVLDKERSSDKMLFDWLIAVTDDPKLIKNNFDDMDSDTIYKMLEIFCRLNHIDEYEKKAEAQMKTA